MYSRGELDKAHTRRWQHTNTRQYWVYLWTQRLLLEGVWRHTQRNAARALLSPSTTKIHITQSNKGYTYNWLLALALLLLLCEKQQSSFAFKHSVSNTLTQNSRFKHTLWTQHTEHKQEYHTICIVWHSALTNWNRTIQVFQINRCPNIMSENTINTQKTQI